MIERIFRKIILEKLVFNDIYATSEKKYPDFMKLTFSSRSFGEIMEEVTGKQSTIEMVIFVKINWDYESVINKR